MTLYVPFHAHMTERKFAWRCSTFTCFPVSGDGLALVNETSRRVQYVSVTTEKN